MKKKLIFSLLVLAGVPSLSMAVDEARLLRFPATNGNEIVFSYAGDLYKVPATGGEARRLTSHVGYEMFPRFSPDGKTIAFTGQYDGNTEVYTMPVTGGEPLRVTYTATNSRDDLGDRMGPNNIVMTWTPDGSRIVYRNRISDGFSGKLFTVEKEGGLSEAIPILHREKPILIWIAVGEESRFMSRRIGQSSSNAMLSLEDVMTNAGKTGILIRKVY